MLTPSSGHGEGPPGGLHQLGQLRLLLVDGVVQVRRPVCGDEVCSDLALLSTTQHLAPVLPSKLCSLAEVAAWAEQEAAPSTRSRARGDMVRVSGSGILWDLQTVLLCGEQLQLRSRGSAEARAEEA